MEKVHGINSQNFIEFLHHQPNLKVFHHDRFTFEGSTQNICKTMAKYCGNQIQYYSGTMPWNQIEGRATEPHLYNFISGFKNPKKAHLTTHQICGGDLIDSIKQLAEINTIETLYLSYSQYDIFVIKRGYVDCIFQNNPNLKGFGVINFKHLKTIIIRGHNVELDDSFHHGKACNPFKLLSVYSSPILSNVENLKIISIQHDWDFIKFMPKLLHLEFHVETTTFQQGLKLFQLWKLFFKTEKMIKPKVISSK